MYSHGKLSLLPQNTRVASCVELVLFYFFLSQYVCIIEILLHLRKGEKFMLLSQNQKQEVKTGRLHIG